MTNSGGRFFKMPTVRAFSQATHTHMHDAVECIYLINGRIKIYDRPGLGIDLNEQECLKHPYVEHNLRHYTGALTDIRPAKTEFYF
jgi:hypothetical protein